MTDAITTSRARLVEQLNAVEERRRRAQLTGTPCEHTWQRFKQTVLPENVAFQGSAYFIVLACTKCREKRNVDYVVDL